MHRLVAISTAELDASVGIHAIGAAADRAIAEQVHEHTAAVLAS